MVCSKSPTASARFWEGIAVCCHVVCCHDSRCLCDYRKPGADLRADARGRGLCPYVSAFSTKRVCYCAISVVTLRLVRASFKQVRLRSKGFVAIFVSWG